MHPTLEFINTHLKSTISAPLNKHELQQRFMWFQNYVEQSFHPTIDQLSQIFFQFQSICQCFALFIPQSDVMSAFSPQQLTRFATNFLSQQFRENMRQTISKLEFWFAERFYQKLEVQCLDDTFAGEELFDQPMQNAFFVRFLVQVFVKLCGIKLENVFTESMKASLAGIQPTQTYTWDDAFEVGTDKVEIKNEVVAVKEKNNEIKDLIGTTTKENLKEKLNVKENVKENTSETKMVDNMTQSMNPVINDEFVTQLQRMQPIPQIDARLIQLSNENAFLKNQLRENMQYREQCVLMRKQTEDQAANIENLTKQCQMQLQEIDQQQVALEKLKTVKLAADANIQQEQSISELRSTVKNNEGLISQLRTVVQEKTQALLQVTNNYKQLEEQLTMTEQKCEMIIQNSEQVQQSIQQRNDELVKQLREKDEFISQLHHSQGINAQNIQEVTSNFQNQILAREQAAHEKDNLLQHKENEISRLNQRLNEMNIFEQRLTLLDKDTLRYKSKTEKQVQELSRQLDEEKNKSSKLKAANEILLKTAEGFKQKAELAVTKHNELLKSFRYLNSCYEDLKNLQHDEVGAVKILLVDAKDSLRKQMFERQIIEEKMVQNEKQIVMERQNGEKQVRNVQKLEEELGNVRKRLQEAETVTFQQQQIIQQHQINQKTESDLKPNFEFQQKKQNPLEQPQQQNNFQEEQKNIVKNEPSSFSNKEAQPKELSEMEKVEKIDNVALLGSTSEVMAQ